MIVDAPGPTGLPELQQDFVNATLSYAQVSHRVTGVLVSVILAQWACETAWGTSYAWRVGNNPAGISPGDEIASYPSINAGVIAYEETMDLGAYAAVRAAQGWNAQAVALGESPWAASHYDNGAGPGSILVDLIQETSLWLYDAALPASAPPTPEPTEGNDDVTLAAAWDPAANRMRVFASNEFGNVIERTELEPGVWYWSNIDALSSNGVPPSVSGVIPQGGPTDPYPTGTTATSEAAQAATDEASLAQPAGVAEVVDLPAYRGGYAEPAGTGSAAGSCGTGRSVTHSVGGTESTRWIRVRESRAHTATFCTLQPSSTACTIASLRRAISSSSASSSAWIASAPRPSRSAQYAGPRAACASFAISANDLPRITSVTRPEPRTMGGGMTASSGLVVSGRCRHCGQELTTEAFAGRTTWRGPCPKCQRPLVCRRVPGQGSAPPAVPEPAKPARAGGTVRKVQGYADTPAPNVRKRQRQRRGAPRGSSHRRHPSNPPTRARRRAGSRRRLRSRARARARRPRPRRRPRVSRRSRHLLSPSRRPLLARQREPVALDPELRLAIAGMGSGLAHLLGVFLNRIADRGRTIKTTRWRMAQSEADAIGEVVAVMAARRVPDVLLEGDGADLLLVGTTLVGYGVRNALNVSPTELVDAQSRFATGTFATPPPAPASSPGWPTAPPRRSDAPPQPVAQPVAPAPTAPRPPPPPRVAAGHIDGVAPPATQASDVVELLTGSDF